MMKDAVLFLLSLGLWLFAAWMAFNGYIYDDWKLFLGALVPAGLGWWAWPSAGPKYHAETRRSPWSY